VNATQAAERKTALAEDSVRDGAILAEMNGKLAEFKQKGYNIPGATTVEVKPLRLRPVIEQVIVDINEAAGDIRHLSGNKFELTAQALKRFRIAGNITFSEPKTTELRPKLIEIEVTGRRFRLNGTPDFLPDRKCIDLEAYEENQRKAAVKKVDDDKLYKNKSPEEKRLIAERKVKEALASRKAYLRECAITGAQRRVVIKLLGIKTAYTKEELQKPFIIVSMIPDTGGNPDPEFLRMIGFQALDITEMMFKTARGISEEKPRMDIAPLAAMEPANVVVEDPDMGASAGPEPFDVETYRDSPREVQEQILGRMFGDRGLPLISFTGMKEEELVGLCKQVASVRGE
jgi:hypothetical protein